MKRIGSVVCLWFPALLLLVVSLPSIGFSEPDSQAWESFDGSRQVDISYYNETILNKSFNIISVLTYNIVKDDFKKEMIEMVRKDDLEKSIKYKSLDHIKGIWTIDCRNRQGKIEKNTFYDYRGKVIDQYTYEASEWKSILPGTTTEKLYKSVCVTK